jgi:limonene-1,2-epoxide hydrolase
VAPEAVVRAFCSAWDAIDLDRIVALLDSDAIYQSGPARPVRGQDQIAALLRKMTRGVSACDFEILHLAVSGDIVFTERRDVVTIGDVTAVLPVVGVFEVRGGLIREWREHFDQAAHERALAGVESGVIRAAE